MSRLAARHTDAAAPSCSSSRPPAEEIRAAVDALRADPPRIHALVAPVAQPLCANVAAALGIDVSMSADAPEVAAMAKGSDALLINLGMLDRGRREASLAAAQSGVPFVLDPVKVDRSPDRLLFARELLSRGPAIVKGNRAEMAALGALPDGCLAVTTGPCDTVGTRDLLRLSNGTPLMDRVIATGCATGVLIAAYLGATGEAYTAAVAALAHINVAAEEAARHSAGPGTFAAALIDALAACDGAHVARLMRCDGPPALDVSCYLVLGPGTDDPAQVAARAVAGGVKLVQWRDKDGDTATQVRAVRDLMAACRVPIVVNDRADVAALTGAALHVGHGDLTPLEARRLVGAAPIGLTVHTMEEAQAAPVDEIAYASVGGVFETTSKRNPNPPIGIDGFRAIAAHLKARRPDLPVCAIAGIDETRAAALAGAGADGVAVMSAITSASDPAAAARAIRAAFEEGRR